MFLAARPPSLGLFGRSCRLVTWAVISPTVPVAKVTSGSSECQGQPRSTYKTLVFMVPLLRLRSACA